MKIINISILLIVTFFLIAIMVPRVISQGTCRPINLVYTNMSSLAQSLKMFKLDNGTYPSTKEGLEALMKNPNSKKYPNYADDGYLDKLPLDSWGNPFRYNHYIRDKKDKFEIISFGADGKYGGEEGDKDVFYPLK